MSNAPLDKMNDIQRRLDSTLAALLYMRCAVANVAEELESLHDPFAWTLDRILDGSYRLGGDMPQAQPNQVDSVR